jgi:hypothetical protein
MQQLMAEHGFFPTTFAYPLGKRNTLLDTALFDEFMILRGITGSSSGELEPHLQACYYNNSNLVWGLGIDSYRRYEYIISLLDYARAENRIIIFFAHKPVHKISGDYQIEYTRMLHLVKYINDNNMEFYTISDFIK